MHLRQGVPKTAWTALVLTFALTLTACGRLGAAPEQRVKEMRGVYQALASVTAEAEVTADYGERVYRYTVSVEGTREAGTMQVQAPENIAGTVLEWSDGATALRYEDVTLETGALTRSGLSPADAVPAILSACQDGALLTCSLEGEEREQLYAELENPDDEDCTVSCWFSTEDYTLLRAELAENGSSVISLTFQSFGITL